MHFLSNMKKSQNQNGFSTFFLQPYNVPVPFWAFLPTEMTDFPTLSEIPTLSYTWSLKKVSSDFW